MPTRLTINHSVYINCLVVMYYKAAEGIKSGPTSIINVQDDYNKYARAMLAEQKYLSDANLLLSCSRNEAGTKRRVRNMIGHTTDRGRERLVHRLRKCGFTVHSIEAPSMDAFYEYNHPSENLWGRIKILELV